MSFVRYAPRPQHKIESVRDGSTVARQSRGFEGLDAGLYGKNMENPDLLEMRPENLPPLPPLQPVAPTAAPGGLWGGIGNALGKLPHAEDGTAASHPLPPMQPFIAGDSTDGEPNEELIIPTARGTHVVPLDKLPKMAQGTVTRSTVPGQEDVLLLENAPGTGFSTNTNPALPPLPESAPQPAAAAESDARGWTRERLANVASEQFRLGNLPETEANIAANQLAEGTDPEAVARFLSETFRGEQTRRADARERARNPQGIIAGVTARAPLTSPNPLPAMSPEDARYARLERDVFRAARDNPFLATGLLNGRAATQRAQLEAEARMALEQFQQVQQNKRNADTIAAQNARAEATRKAAEDRDAINNNFRLAREGREMATFGQQFIKPEVSTVPIDGTNYVVPFAGNKALGTLPTNTPPSFDLMQLPGTNTFFPALNGKPDLARPFTQNPAQPGFSTVFAPGQGGPSFEPAKSSTKPERPHIVTERIKDAAGSESTTHWEFYRDDRGTLRKRRIEEDGAASATTTGAQSVLQRARTAMQSLQSMP